MSTPLTTERLWLLLKKSSKAMFNLLKLKGEDKKDGSLQPFEFSLEGERLITRDLGGDLTREELLEKQGQSTLYVMNLWKQGTPVKPFVIKEQLYFPGPTGSYVKRLVLVYDDESTDVEDADTPSVAIKFPTDDESTDVEDADTPSDAGKTDADKTEDTLSDALSSATNTNKRAKRSREESEESVDPENFRPCKKQNAI